MLRVEGLAKGFGARTLLEGVTFQVQRGDCVGLVGRNGEGKTTLLRLLAGLETADDGRIELARGARVGFLRQEIDPRRERPVIEEVRTVHAPLRALEQRLREQESEIAEAGRDGRPVPVALAARYDALTSEFEARGGFAAEADLRATLTGLGFSPTRWERPLSSFSGGWLMRVELAKLLLARPDLLLLDEPTNHLDLPSIRWFEGVLATYPGAAIVVSHDRTFLDRHTSLIAELGNGKLTSYRGNYSAYLAQKRERAQVLAARRSNLDRQIAHAETFVRRFGAKATKARQAESRKKRIAKLREERDGLALDPERRALRFRFRPAPRSGEIVMRLERVRKAFGDTLVYASLDLELRRGDRVALVGPNGAGKSTLLRIAAGALELDAGSRELGHNVALGFYGQHQLEALDAARTVLEEMEAHAPLEEIPRLRTLLGTFLFSGDDVNKKVSVLSGGEKSCVALAKLLLGGRNFLLLDEPTNHLDMQAREVLASALEQFRGTVLFITHDRSFINRLCNRVLEVMPGPDGARVRSFPGNYDDYLRRIDAESAPSESPRPARAVRKAPRRSDTRLRELRARVAVAEGEIEQAEREVERLAWLSADPALARDGERMRELELERRGVATRLESLYSEWETLAGQMEAIETLD